MQIKIITKGSSIIVDVHKNGKAVEFIGGMLNIIILQ